MPQFLYYPTKPNTLIQGFAANPAYYARFLDKAGNPLKGHMGLDFVAAHGTPLYAVCDGLAFYATDDHGGDGIYINATPATGGRFYVINWHLCSKDDPHYKPLIPTDGSWTPVKAGQLIGYTDNTGAPFESSGDHLHLGLMPLSAQGAILQPSNGFGGCVDPTPYFNGKYAADITNPPAPIPSMPPLSTSDQIAVLAAQKLAAGQTAQANTLFALAKFLKAFGY